MAAANNRKLSITFKTTVLKSIALIDCIAWAKKSGLIFPIPITAKEAINEISIIPIVPGSLINRWFKYPKVAVNKMITVIK
jgi:hypothetical protein